MHLSIELYMTKNIFFKINQNHTLTNIWQEIANFRPKFAHFLIDSDTDSHILQKQALIDNTRLKKDFFVAIVLIKTNSCKGSLVLEKRKQQWTQHTSKFHVHNGMKNKVKIGWKRPLIIGHYAYRDQEIFDLEKHKVSTYFCVSAKF